MSAVLERMYRRMHGAIGFGAIKAADDTGAAHKVQLQFHDGQQRDDTVVLSFYGLVSHAKPGTQAVYVAVGGDRSNAVVVGTGDAATRPRGTQPGTVGIYSDLGLQIFLTPDGIRIDCAGKDIVVTNGTKAHFDMPIESTGEITANVTGAAVHMSAHKHSDAQGGTVGGPVG